MPLPPPAPRTIDRPLHDDVRTLASILGKVISRLEGEPAFLAVEELRLACRARRKGETDVPLNDLLVKVEALDNATAHVVGRAFALFFLLINTAEQVHRVRRRRSYPAYPAQPASPRWLVGQLKHHGYSATQAATLLDEVEVRPVFTAHPTESTRRTVLNIQARVAEQLLSNAPDRDTRLEVEVELLWLTSEVRRDRPSVLDEVSTVLWYLEDRLLAASRDVTSALRVAFREVYGEDHRPRCPLRWGSWVGGDRDGNPFVTPEVTIAATRRAAHRLLGRYRKQLDELTVMLSLSKRLTRLPPSLEESLLTDRELLPDVWKKNHRRDADEPVRLKLTYMSARVAHSRRRIASLDAGRPEVTPAAYPNAQALLNDLLLVRETLDSSGAQLACASLIDPFIAEVETAGFHGFELDIRQESVEHTAALNAIFEAIGEPAPDRSVLVKELLGRRPLCSPDTPLDDQARGVVDVFDVMRSVQDEVGGMSSYVISMSRGPEDLLRVLLLARDAGLVDLAAEPPQSRIDVVPLFETHADLLAAPGTMESLFNDPAYARQLLARGNSQEIMIGYSDSAKDAGVLPAAWALYEAQERLAEVFAKHGIALTLFHGRGGTVGRGGGSPVYRAMSALPAGTVQHRMKITEQGELVSQKFGLTTIADRSAEVMVAGTVMASLTDWRQDLEPGEEATFRSILSELSSVALPVFRHRVHETHELFELFSTATPVKELAHVHYGSRPAFRERAVGKMAGIRAIPWVFGWTQMRLMLPGWFGVGTALETVAQRADGLVLLQRMARMWPFFDDLIGKVEMVCAKADLNVARIYVESLAPEQLPLFEELAEEFHRAVKWVLAVRQQQYLLADQPVLQASIGLRNPYVDPLSLLQIALVKRKRANPEQSADLGPALGATLNGVAQGLRNTG
jgi:phosphoenolpyruvate carboxylase